MAGIDVAVGGDSKVFVAGTTACQTLSNAGTVIQSYIEVEEVEGIALATLL